MNDIPRDASRNPESGTPHQDNAAGALSAELPTEPRVPAEVLRRVREAIGLLPPEVAHALRVGRSSYYRFEGSDAPPWLLLALGGLGVGRYGRSVAEMAALLGIDPDTDPPRTEQGTYAPIVPTVEQRHALRGTQEASPSSNEG